MDILATVKKSKERTKVMFEVPTREHDVAGQYKAELIKFLAELGFDASFENMHSNRFKIEGLDIEGDFSQISSVGTMFGTRAL